MNHDADGSAQLRHSKFINQLVPLRSEFFEDPLTISFILRDLQFKLTLYLLFDRLNLLPDGKVIVEL